tara:strand:+ start:1486 stop:1668 length:183 start_codon:yes stop_codon:yes gene_type:complete
MKAVLISVLLLFGFFGGIFNMVVGSLFLDFTTLLGGLIWGVGIIFTLLSFSVALVLHNNL